MDICDGLIRRKVIAGAGLQASDGININRISASIRYKCHKNHANMEYGMKLDNFESVKDRISAVDCCREEEAEIKASEIVCRYSLGIATETISDATFKASKVLNWRCHEKRVGGSIADSGFKPTVKLEGNRVKHYDREACDAYVKEAFGVPRQELSYFALFAAKIFRIDIVDALTVSRQVIAIEKIIEAAFEASQALNLLRSRVGKPTEPIERENHREKTVVGEDEPLKECQTELSDKEKPTEPIDKENHREKTVVGEDEPSKECQTEHSDKGDSSSNKCYDTLLEALKPGFMEGRDEMCIFLDCEQSCERYEELMNMLFQSSVNINWGRMASYMEFKARKEFAMETYCVRVGDFHSIKENAVRLFAITEEKAAIMASKTMELDSESIAFEKIADAAFKASKILNWNDGNKSGKEVWAGSVADARRFKSPKSMTNFCTNMDIEARKAYTMEAFGVSLVETDYIKDLAIESFLNNKKELKEAEAIIMACESVAVDHVVDAASKYLNLELQLHPLEAEMAKAMPVLICPMPAPNFIFSPENRLA